MNFNRKLSRFWWQNNLFNWHKAESILWLAAQNNGVWQTWCYLSSCYSWIRSISWGVVEWLCYQSYIWKKKWIRNAAQCGQLFRRAGKITALFMQLILGLLLSIHNLSDHYSLFRPLKYWGLIMNPQIWIFSMLRALLHPMDLLVLSSHFPNQLLMKLLTLLTCMILWQGR